jgi:tetratricopeptide (TPR) repeat protein
MVMGRFKCPARNSFGVTGKVRRNGSPEYRSNARRLTWLPAGIALLTVVLAGCHLGHIRTLREAENTFSEAAAADNRSRLDEAISSVDTSDNANSHRLASESAIGEISRAAVGYRLAAKMVDEIISKKRKDLMDDDLLCTAYVIKAMSLWKLGDYEQAIGTAQAGENCSAANPPGGAAPREMALLKAIPGLARIDEANALLADLNTGQDRYMKIQKEIKEALDILQSASGQISAEHPVRAYFLLSRLAAIRVWQTAIVKYRLEGQIRETEMKNSHTYAEETWSEYRKFLECQLGRRSDPSVIHWADLLGIGRPSESVKCQ